jgi:hypothetical protein
MKYQNALPILLIFFAPLALFRGPLFEFHLAALSVKWLRAVHCGGHRPRRVVGSFGQARALAAVPARLIPAHPDIGPPARQRWSKLATKAIRDNDARVLQVLQKSQIVAPL